LWRDESRYGPPVVKQKDMEKEEKKKDQKNKYRIARGMKTDKSTGIHMDPRKKRFLRGEG